MFEIIGTTIEINLMNKNLNKEQVGIQTFFLKFYLILFSSTMISEWSNYRPLK